MFHIVDIHQRMHTCPADPLPHPFDTRRTVVAVVDGGPCRAPVTVRCADTIATVACGRQLPPAEQCPACRVIVTERHITTELVADLGPQHLIPVVAA
jgi:hypothetical protein